jgi:hypothetical protein
MKLFLLLLTFASLTLVVLGYRPSQPPRTTSRRDTLVSASAAFVAVIAAQQRPALAFSGSGSSAYSGRAPASKAALQKSYKDRVVADIRDFNALGRAIDNGQLDGNVWVSFFIQFARQEADSVGRTYAALADLMGNKEGGGCGLLLAASFAKPNKPPDNAPAVQKFKKLVKAFDPIKAAGLKGDADKAKKEWQNASVLLSEYLQEVELPSALDDPIYK